eukprot:TRINITY_DN65742_c0_g1_i1.p1 TRINITY_DN65742_c0_g1~~TRINITY_DN65742_c0_g1_i1.p1  ORF type:complete len:351 (+),score=65.36 TRINITY_DN65742_c0_g1_i1:71-1054(+)
MAAQGGGGGVPGRPGALHAAVPYDQMSRDQLVAHFLRDVRGGAVSAPGPAPAKPACAALRVVQWNINVLQGPDSRSTQQPQAVHAVLGAQNAEVIVLQECGCTSDDVEAQDSANSGEAPSGIAQLAALLRADGYELHIARNYYPALLASRLPMAHAEYVQLDDYRGAACGVVNCGGRQVRIYATHLDHSSGEARKLEAGRLLQHHGAAARSCPLPTLVFADWNQPRQQDYTPEEWAQIARSAAGRCAPEDDGVSSLLASAGFRNCFDAVTATRNWPAGSPPPLTHWAGICIDSAYGSGLDAVGTYVVSSELSDHLPVVSDWAFPGPG